MGHYRILLLLTATNTTSPVTVGTELLNYFLTTPNGFLPTSQILLASPNKVL